MSRSTNFTKFTLLSGGIAASTSGTEQTIDVQFVVGGEWPTLVGGRGVIWQRSRGTPDADPNHEIVAITGINEIGDQLTVIRGAEATTAPAHNTAGETYELRIVHSAQFIEVRSPELTPQDFGAKGDDVTDDGPAFQDLFNAAVATSGCRDIYIPRGNYRIATQVTLPGSSGAAELRIRGAGCSPNGGANIQCETTSGHTFDLDRDALSVAGLNLWVSDVRFTNTASKTNFYCLRFDKLTNSTFTNCYFDGNSTATRGMVRLDNSFQVKFYGCDWDGAGAYFCIDAVNDNTNGGELLVSGCNMSTPMCGIKVEGSSTFQRLTLLHSKFGPNNRAKSGTQIYGTGGVGSLTGWTAGATSLDVGTGHTLSYNQMPLVISAGGTSPKPEVVFGSSYSSPNLTLHYGLQSDWSSAGTVYAMTGGSVAWVGLQHVNTITVEGCHHEAASGVICGANNVHIKSNTFSTLNYDDPELCATGTQGRIYLIGHGGIGVGVYHNDCTLDNGAGGTNGDNTYFKIRGAAGGIGTILTGWNSRHLSTTYTMEDDIVGGTAATLHRQILTTGGNI